jgi:hypothetical protein
LLGNEQKVVIDTFLFVAWYFFFFFNSKVSAHVSQICLIRVDIVGFFVLLGFIQSAQLLIVYCKKFIYVHRAVLVRRIKHNLLRIFRSCFSLF